MTVRLPWDFGTIVYLRIRDSRVRGMLTGYTVHRDSSVCWVTWPDGNETRHYPYELTTEFVPDYPSDE